MKKYILGVLSIICLSGCSAKKTATAGSEYQYALNLIKEKDFFKARDYIEGHRSGLSNYQELILKANISNLFNKPEESNKCIALLFSKYATNLTNDEKLALLNLRQANCGRLFDYKSAYDAVGEKIAKYGDRLPAAERADDQNTKKIWGALMDQPKQEVILNGSTLLQMTRDKANLKNLKVQFIDKSIEFIFDTGANFSTVTASTAKAFNMKVLDVEIEVGAITGTVVKSKLAVSPEFSIGNIRVKNAIFLVMPDEALAFRQIDYQINGILGFPVIEALKEIQLTSDDQFFVPASQTDYDVQNLALDFLNPVIALNGDSYTFDTGATSTSLYPKYLDKYKNE